MTTIKVGQARTKLDRLVEEAAAAHEPILITGKRANMGNRLHQTGPEGR